MQADDWMGLKGRPGRKGLRKEREQVQRFRKKEKTGTGLERRREKWIERDEEHGEGELGISERGRTRFLVFNTCRERAGLKQA